MTGLPLTDEEIDKVSQFTFNLQNWINKKAPNLSVQDLKEQYENTVGLFLKSNVIPELILLKVAPDPNIRLLEAFAKCSDGIDKPQDWTESNADGFSCMTPSAFGEVLERFTVARRNISAAGTSTVPLEEIRRQVKADIIETADIKLLQYERDERPKKNPGIPTYEDFNKAFHTIIAVPLGIIYASEHGDLYADEEIKIAREQLARSFAREANGMIALGPRASSAQAAQALETVLIDKGVTNAALVQIMDDIRTVAGMYGVNVDKGARKLN